MKNRGHTGKYNRRKIQTPQGFIFEYRLFGRSLPKRTDGVRLGKLFRHVFFRHLSGTGHKPFSPHIKPWMRSAYFLHEDRDQDGRIERLILYFRNPPPAEMKSYAHTFERADHFHRYGWTFKLDFTGPLTEIKDSLLFGQSSTWNSYTPYFPRDRDCGRYDILQSVYRECKKMRLPEIAGYSVINGGIPLESIYHRVETKAFYSLFRKRYKHYPYGASIQICFERPIHGPLLLGYGRHIGAGLFCKGKELTLGTRWDIDCHYGFTIG